MSKTSINTRLNTFLTDLGTLKATSKIKYVRVVEKTSEYINIIKAEEENYKTGSDLDVKYSTYLDYCESILTTFTGLTINHLEYWK